MTVQKRIYNKNSRISPAISSDRGTWFLGRSKTAASKSISGTGPQAQQALIDEVFRGTWFLGRKTGTV